MIFGISNMCCSIIIYTLGRICKNSNDACVLIQLAHGRECVLKPDGLIYPSHPIGHELFDREERRFERFACERVLDCPNHQSSIVAYYYLTTITSKHINQG